METLASFWSRDPCDLGQSGHELSALWDSQSVVSCAPPVSHAMWAELSPHLQRNKQLHDTLLQREEELARLQEENTKLRQFLNSSFVKDLEEKAKRLCVDGRRKRKSSSSIEPISKRVCRNLSAQFCSESEPSEPTLDLWVLKTLGLKDKDTIDTTVDTNNPSSFSSTISSTDFLMPEVYNSTGYSSQTRPKHAYLNEQSPSFTLRESSFVEQQEVIQWSSPLQTTINYSPSKRLHFLPMSYSAPEKSCTEQNNNAILSLCDHAAPHSQSDLAFRMSLSPSSSVKTHSFPQGQAFVRRDPQGRCNFTWVPQDRA